MAIFPIVVFVVQSAHNEEVFATDRDKLLHLRYRMAFPSCVVMANYGSVRLFRILLFT
jgi:hypothetical protein